MNKAKSRPQPKYRPPEHWLGRPSGNSELKEVERWTGAQWVKDDGKPGLAFSGLDGSTPIAWSSEGCACDSQASHEKCPMNRSLRYTAKRFGCANGQVMKRLRLRRIK